MASTFMYYPGHAPGGPVVDTCAAANAAALQHHQQQHQQSHLRQMEAHQQQQQQQQHSQQQQQYAASAAAAAAAPYGYYQNGLAAAQGMAAVQQQQQHQQQQAAAFYNQQQHQHQQQAVAHHRRTSSFRQQPTLPPLGMFYPGAPPATILPLPLQQEAPAPREEYVNGGVNQFLDYDLDLMSEFVIKKSYNAFGTDAGAVIRETGSNQTVDLFTKGVFSVLSATRLPAVTIFMALDLLSKYVTKTHAASGSIRSGCVNVVYQNTMVAFVLANKFNDDKTFTNKSWSQATGMDVLCINNFEREWLDVLEWRLFDDKFVHYDEYAHAFEIFCQEKRCPSPPNMLPAPHSTDNYLSPPSDCQTPVHLNANVYSSPGFLEKDTNDFYYGQPGVLSSPVSQFTPNSAAAYSTTSGGPMNYNFYNFGPPQPAAAVQPMMGLPPAHMWNMDERFGNFASSNFPGFDNNYYCYSAVY
ncbi:ZYRO0E08646p [Zygosaccharomyces rouxii]|uniref:ZYRO0E08646p n=1 Tax=Zygosaccharomyces rouxii (strain ATCC 2623 / CBS 732 / NBRC 1130 / NCYC 568 / NRRL Y-229) TaxID=559307 RepID=C5E4T6_ZYGRC|nr:uncharacterized protein ZYRO0E08646g [Zygosaccharomyces rouxii]KAH9198097.1 hypothetical protein LQ764DRAFT_146602 [Zygosaccharomyces rouxii]CAR31047.1 ZYRO0E08646p [Zygosaccharomyces rouxii]